MTPFFNADNKDGDEIVWNLCWLVLFGENLSETLLMSCRSSYMDDDNDYEYEVFFSWMRVT